MGENDIELHNMSASISRRHSRSPATLSSDSGLDHTLTNTEYGVGYNAEYDIEYGPEHEESHRLQDLVPSLSWRGPSSKNYVKSKPRLFLKALWAGPIEASDPPPRPFQSLRFFEELPGKFRARLSKVRQSLIFVAYLSFWLLLWSKILLPYLVEPPQTADGQKVVSLTCDQADLFWKGKNAACGLNAKDCESSVTRDDVVFRCPALCDRGSWLYSLRAVGPNVVKYRGYFIGGGSRRSTDDILSYPYRADSFPCGAAVHSGLVSPFFGGCARISYASGPQAEFEGTGGHYGVADSIGFGSFFPFSYVFKLSTASPSRCYDPRLLVLIANIILGIPVVLFAPAAAFFWTMAIVGFWTIVTATDPPVLVDPADAESFYRLVSVGLERFLPTCFVLYVLWMVSVKRTFSPYAPFKSRPSLSDTAFGETPDYENLHANTGSPLSRLLLWYPLFWLGILNNITFDRLPVDRLTWHDLQVQPGALLTVVVVALLLMVCVVAQAYYVWLLGRFWKLLLVYGGIFAGLFLLGNLPGLTLRIHHYIFALVFIPGCSTRGRTAYAFQGILLGLFLSGVARWGYASIAETDLSLLRGEPSGQIGTPEITGFKDALMLWQTPFNDTYISTEAPPEHATVSLLVNDIERFRGESNGTLDIAQLLSENKELVTLLQLEHKQKETPLYLRLAKYLEEKNEFGDYTRAAVLKVPSFEFAAPPPGIT